MNSLLHLQSLPLFQDLDEQELAQAGELSHVAQFPPGVTLFWQNAEVQFLHVVVSGYVSLNASLAGQEQTVLLARDGCAFPLSALAGGGRAVTSARTACASRLVLVPVALVAQLLEENHRFARRAMQQAVAVNDALITESRDRSLKSPRQRIAAWVLDHVTGDENGGRFPLPVSRKTLASALGLSYSTFSAEVARLGGHGLVFSKSDVVVDDAAALTAIAGLDRPAARLQ